MMQDMTQPNTTLTQFQSRQSQLMPENRLHLDESKIMNPQCNISPVVKYYSIHSPDTLQCIQDITKSLNSHNFNQNRAGNMPLPMGAGTLATQKNLSSQQMEEKLRPVNLEEKL